jgi:hypothetical protein
MACRPRSEASCSLVLAAADADGLARFYGALLALAPEAGLGPGHWRLPLPGGGLLELYAPSRRRGLAEAGGRQALCLQRRGNGDTLATWIAEACAAGAQLAEPARQEPFGWEAWLLDPEGNRLLLLVLPA